MRASHCGGRAERSAEVGGGAGELGIVEVEVMAFAQQKFVV